MIKKVKVLNKDECENIFKIILELKSFWKLRNEDDHPFELPRFTLGAVSYIDAISSYHNYQEEAALQNPLLERHLSDLYIKVLHELEKATGIECEYSKTNALPGFHIFGSDIYFEEEAGKFHHDRQNELIDWGEICYDPIKNLSFTLSIKLPSRGAGLILLGDQVEVENSFKENKADSQILKEVIENSFQMNTIFQTRDDTHINLNELEFIKYEEGYMFIHSGKFTHAMAPAIEMSPEDMRITLQGHGILDEKSNKYLIYW
jgi:hypothetical protein